MDTWQALMAIRVLAGHLSTIVAWAPNQARIAAVGVIVSPVLAI